MNVVLRNGEEYISLDMKMDVESYRLSGTFEALRITRLSDDGSAWRFLSSGTILPMFGGTGDGGIGVLITLRIESETMDGNIVRPERRAAAQFNVLIRDYVVEESEDVDPAISLLPIAGPVSFGQTLTLDAQADAGDAAAVRYVWHASPVGNNYEDPITEHPRAALTFGRMGRAQIFVELQALESNVWVKVAESDIQEVEVVAPEFELRFTPPSGGRMGETLRVQVSTRPPVPAELIEYQWLQPLRRNTHVRNAAEISFMIGDGTEDPMDSIPIRANALASVPLEPIMIIEMYRQY